MPFPWSRRDALRLGGTTVALVAGCTGTPQRQSEITTTEIAEVTVTGVTVTPALVALNSPDSIDTFGDRDKQFFVATVATDGAPAPAHNSYELVVAENTYKPKTDLTPYGRLWHDGDVYENNSSGTSCFLCQTRSMQTNPRCSGRVASTLWPRILSASSHGRRQISS